VNDQSSENTATENTATESTATESTATENISGEATELVGFGSQATGVLIGQGSQAGAPKKRAKFQASEIWAITMTSVMFATAIAWLVHRFG